MITAERISDVLSHYQCAAYVLQESPAKEEKKKKKKKKDKDKDQEPMS